MKSSGNKLGRFLLWNPADEKQAVAAWPAGSEPASDIHHPSSFFGELSSDYLLAVDSSVDVVCNPPSLQKLLAIARDTGAGMVYSDFFDKSNSKVIEHPLIDYQTGSIRDDFNFGHFFIYSVSAIKTALQKYGPLPDDALTALYDLRLKISVDHVLFHVPEFLYTASPQKREPVTTADSPTEAQFSYVAKDNFASQQAFEKMATNYLKQVRAHLPPRMQKAPEEATAFEWEASVIIPVLNRKKTITEALESALSQNTNFAFNIIVVDNHSTDGTTDILRTFAAKYSNVKHLIPSRQDLGIGGCWNEAIQSPFCGRYVVQLDSDDLYSSPRALQKIVNTLHQGKYAMVVGAYSLVNERLKPIPPGLIDHREWTQKNGHNNLLRVNGMGAPRAFDTSVIRQFGFPNVSYGEDYAVALRISREYKIGRLFESLYLCRRWSDNTDAGLSVEKQNRNDYYKDKLRTMEIQARQLENRIFAEFTGKENLTLPSLCRNLFDSQKETWPALACACRNLESVRTRQLSCGSYDVTLQYNPARAVSSGAAVDAESIKKRPCFLCAGNRPAEQSSIVYRNDYTILCNPAPIFHHHFTVVSLTHRPQEISSSLSSFLQLAADASPDYTVLYNGPSCGASAPDHLHFQMIPSMTLPFLNELRELPPIKETGTLRYSIAKGFDRCILVMESKNANALKDHFSHLLKGAQEILSTSDEPLMNLLCAYEQDCWRLTIFLRRKHRPDAYFAKGENRIFISPGAIDMAGAIITPQLKDYERLDGETVQNIYREISLDEETLNKIIKDTHHE